MFQPKYTITDKLLNNVTRIYLLVRGLNDRRFPSLILAEMENTARAVSTFASTSIEGNSLPLTVVKQLLKNRPAQIQDTEREVLNYNQAMVFLRDLLAQDRQLKLSLPLVLKIHKTVTDGLMPRFESGKLRQKPVWVNDPRTGQPVYLPPDHEQVDGLMRDLITYVNRRQDEVDPLIIAGVFHKQMVIIHPFMDGNGRTTRLATKILLARMGLDTFNLFSFENYYNQDVTRYFSTVGEFGDYLSLTGSIDFTAWLEYFTQGIIDELQRVSALLPDLSVEGRYQLDSHLLQILDLIRQNGYVTDSLLAQHTSRAKATRTLDFKRLLDLGLIERQGGGRSTYYTMRVA